MVNENIIYGCKKCGITGIKKAIEEHEKTRTTGICKSLDGLVVRVGYEDNYAVITKADCISRGNHKALYNYETYEKRGLKHLESDMKTARLIVGINLTLSHSENDYKDYTELSTAEFMKVTRRLKKKYPELYMGKKFNRILKYRRSRT
jgi:hypothetical protein